ncbi:uncharacterized protein NECHADRAFT_55951 [Fusarium vanettenii 77-13-4]|uniref:Major facilitator superfamily (MFS) profile domain-containing protein n=1 Tax=Fusarium vanettenii (strain ATCC MYA-4622 / CBS 123669 / FGSC 9596 / NRRL 45880 / 77-13-4) TaxID=660122 RepID=C7ZQ52_FUSV7|nr:uncharacterized protein NECHADRAFT_55951 [Fusarium vanettenii 77-13-4]EEU33847.1 hypothetical protein NECHADRAFT_55951 [Fusarium vanettenii 77-13-4]
MAANIKWHELPNNTNPVWYKDAGLRHNVALGLGLCLVIATNVSSVSHCCPQELHLIGMSVNEYLQPKTALANQIQDQVSILTGFQAMPSWQIFFKRPTGALLGIYVASFFIPSIVTPWIGDWISTKFGRRWCIIIANIIILIGALVNTFTVNIGMWCGVVGLYIPGNWGWRFPSLLQVIGPVAVILWLIMNDREDQARQILAALHANGDINDALVQFEVEQISTSIQKEALQQQASLADFLRTPGNRRRLVTIIAMACSLNWMGNGIIAYYLAPILQSVGITAPVQITLINVGLAIWNLILAAAAAVNCDKVGRRPLFLLSTAGMLCSYAVVMGLSAGFANTKTKALGIAVIPFLFIYYGFYDTAYTPLPIAYTVEILPFSIRSKGMALFTSTATLGNAFNQFVNPIALKSIQWRYYAVYIGILIFYFVFIFFMFPETKRLSAEDASKVFDFDRKGHPLGKAVDVERDAKKPGDEKEPVTSIVTHDDKE